MARKKNTLAAFDGQPVDSVKHKADARTNIPTRNRADFTAAELARFDFQAQHPDDFLVAIFDEAPGAVCTVVKQQRESLRNPPKTAEELLSTLETPGRNQAATRFRQFIELI